MSVLPRATVLAGLFLTGLGAAMPAPAAAGCTAWFDQGNGTSWAMCVGDDGVQHCWVINNSPGSTAYEVSCGG